VRDARGNYVGGLAQGDFVLLEDGNPQEIVLFSEEPEAPIRVAFLLDVSGSMALQDRLPMARGAIRYFLDRMGPEDEAALFVFAEGSVDVIADFTRDRRAITDGLLSREGYGQTALIDAVARAPKLVPRSANQRGAILLFSDGVDNISNLSVEQALDLARRTEVPVYSVGILDRQEARRRAKGAEALREFSRETGGEAFFADDFYQINRASRLIAQELKQAYVLGYYPSPGSHSVRVEASCRGCVVSSRQGLYASAADEGD
jgi:Ca-activated chloride channel family protein